MCPGGTPTSHRSTWGQGKIDGLHPLFRVLRESCVLPPPPSPGWVQVQREEGASVSTLSVRTSAGGLASAAHLVLTTGAQSSCSLSIALSLPCPFPALQGSWLKAYPFRGRAPTGHPFPGRAPSGPATPAVQAFVVFGWVGVHRETLMGGEWLSSITSFPPPWVPRVPS